MRLYPDTHWPALNGLTRDLQRCPCCCRYGVGVSVAWTFPLMFELLSISEMLDFIVCTRMQGLCTIRVLKRLSCCSHACVRYSGNRSLGQNYIYLLYTKYEYSQTPSTEVLLFSTGQHSLRPCSTTSSSLTAHKRPCN